MKPSKRLFVYISTMLALAVLPTFAQSEEPFRLFVTGGFLGQLDGFQELPVAPYTEETPGVMKPWGGLDAASDWIARYYGRDKDFLLISPDNFPLHFAPEKLCANGDDYWKALLALNADAIGLGKEDLLRALHSGADKSKNGRGQRLDLFLKWMRDGSCGLPLIASNLIVKETKQGINTVSSGPVKVHLSADESVPLSDQLVIEIDDEVDTTLATVTLQVITEKDGKLVADGDPIPTSIKWEDIDGHDVTQRVTPQPAIARAKLKGMPLLPGFEYRLIVEWNADKKAVLEPLHTVRLVAPRTWASVPGSTKPKVPFQVISKGKVNIFAFNFIDPALKSLLPAEAWKYGDKNDRQEVVLQSPVETVQAWKSVIDAYCDSTRVCMFALISALDDPGTIKLLGKMPEFRLNIVSPETALLGRVARKEKGYSGDLGYHAEFNQSVPKATQVLLRPEWVGETVISVDGKVGPGAPSSLTISHIENNPVPGRILRWVACNGRPDSVCYQIDRTAGGTVNLGMYPRYRPLDSVQYGDVWRNETDFLQFAADAMRKGRHSELAILPEAFIDPDVIEWLNATKIPNDSASQFLLERVLFRQERVIKTIQNGRNLKALLKKLADEANTTESRFCVKGIVPSGCFLSMRADDANRLKVNGRLLLDDEYYSVAVPEGFAQAQKLVYNEDRYIDLVEEVHRELLRLGRSPSELPNAPARPPCLPNIVGVNPPATTPTSAFAAPLQENIAAAQPQSTEPIVPKNRLESHPIWFFSMPAPSFQFNSQALKLMDGSSLGNVKDQFSKIPLAGSKVTNKDSFAFKSHIELGVDLRQFEIMARSDFDFGVDRFPGIEQPGISPNQMLIGGIGRWKLPIPKFPIALLGGFFLDRNPFSPPNDQFTATLTRCEKPAPLGPADIKNGCTALDPALVTSYPQGRTITTNGPSVTVITRKGDYRFLGLGTETIRTLQPFSRITVGQLSFRYDIGTDHASREGVSVAGTPFTMDDYVNQGVQALMSQVLQSNSSLLGHSSETVQFEYRQRPQKRLNVASQVDFQVYKDKYEHDLKFTVTPKFQKWSQFEGEPTLSPKWNLDLKIQMNLPVPKFPRFAFIPYWERQWVKANGIENPFVLERYGIEVQIPLSVKLGNGRLWY